MFKEKLRHRIKITCIQRLVLLNHLHSTAIITQSPAFNGFYYSVNLKQEPLKDELNINHEAMLVAVPLQPLGVKGCSVKKRPCKVGS